MNNKDLKQKLEEQKQKLLNQMPDFKKQAEQTLALMQGKIQQIDETLKMLEDKPDLKGGE